MAARPRSVAGSLRSSQSLCFIGIGLHAQERLRQTASIMPSKEKKRGDSFHFGTIASRCPALSGATENNPYAELGIRAISFRESNMAFRNAPATVAAMLDSTDGI